MPGLRKPAAAESTPLCSKAARERSASCLPSEVLPVCLVTGLLVCILAAPVLQRPIAILGLRLRNRWWPPSHPGCPVAAGVRWCWTLPGLDVACHHADSVCKYLCSHGYWEFESLPSLRFPNRPAGDVIDVGAGVGWYSLLFAQGGYKVHAFEALPGNVRLLESSLCANPTLPGRVILHQGALTATPRSACEIFSGEGGVGDGLLCCPGDLCELRHSYKKRDEVQWTSTMDHELVSLNAPISFMRLDVEGRECDVLQGARSLLGAHPPQYVLSKVWKLEIGCEAEEYMELLRGANYSVSLGLGGASSMGSFRSSKRDSAPRTAGGIRDPGGIEQPLSLFALRPTRSLRLSGPAAIPGGPATSIRSETRPY